MTVHPADAAPPTDAFDPLPLDKFFPRFDFVVRQHLVVDAPPAATNQAVGELRTADLRSPTLRVLAWIRGVPARLPPRASVPSLTDLLLGDKWVLLGESPGEQLILGAAGRFWTPRMEWHDITVDEFANYDKPRSGTIAAAFSVRAYGLDKSLLSLEVRVAVANHASHRWASGYWHTIAPATRFVAKTILRSIRDMATR
ncbi:MAG: hypothetical protein JWP02_2791 [Acidimicrobiales bacterium]|jgi:hypothetical protein|nr:hypothetical protein [Acidimicrobiales bacterium]